MGESKKKLVTPGAGERRGENVDQRNEEEEEGIRSKLSHQAVSWDGRRKDGMRMRMTMMMMWETFFVASSTLLPARKKQSKKNPPCLGKRGEYVRR